jgi:6-bladed beta-propeller
MGYAMRNGGRLMTATLAGAALAALALAGEPKRLAVREVQPKPGAGTPFLSRPVAVVCDDESVFILDSGDADIKIFSRDGEFRRTIGRKGQGPAEFRLPNDIDIYGGRLYIADSANRRIQILDDRGHLLGGFAPRMAPWRILVLNDDSVLVAGLASARSRGEKLIGCFRRNGALVWQAVDALQSADAVYDALRNQVFLRRSPGGGFRIVWSFDNRLIRTLDARGFRTGEAMASEADMPFKPITLPTAGGRKKMLRGFCWSCAAAGGRLYLLAPEYTEDNDLGPGKVIAAFGASLELESLIELPEKITRFAVAGDTVYAIDTDCRLRLFRFEKH